MTQCRNRKTECPHCKNLIGNSGFKNHVAACEKKHNEPQTETQNRDEETQTDPLKQQLAQLQTRTQIQTEKQEDDEMPDHIDAEPVILIHHGDTKTTNNTSQEVTAFDRFFDAAGRFLDSHGETVAAVIAPLAVAFAESKQQQQPAQTATGEEW